MPFPALGILISMLLAKLSMTMPMTNYVIYSPFYI